MTLGRSVVRGAIWGQAGFLLAFALQTLLQIVLARGLGSDQYGLYAAINGTVYLLLAVASGGVLPTLNTHLSRLEHQHGRAAAAYLFWRLWMWRLLVFAVVGAGLVVFAGPIASAFLNDPGQTALVRASVLYLVGIGLFQIVNMVFFGLLRAQWGAAGNALSASVNVAVSGFLMWQGVSVTVLMASLGLAQLAVCAIQLARAWVSIRPSKEVAELDPAVRRDVRGLWRFSATVWVGEMLNYALGKQTDIFTMEIFRTPQAEVGFYNLAVTLAISANAVLLQGMGSVALSGLSALRTRAPERLGAGWRTLCSVGPLLSVPILVFVGVFAEPIVVALYGHAYKDAAVVLEIFIGFVIAGQVLGGGAHVTAFAALGVPGRTLKSRGVLGVANLAVNVVLIPFYGAKGAALGTGACGALTILYEYILLRPYVKERLPWGDRARSAVALLPGLLPAWFIAPHLGLLGVLVAGAVYLGCYAAILAVLRPVRLDPDMASAVPRLARRFVRVNPAPDPAEVDRAPEPAAL
jgi:O-antigen/teichoic acid export membrane protein